MSRVSPSQVSSDSIDSVGVSVTISPRRADDFRYGTVFDTDLLAGVAPLHLHPLTNEQYLLVFSRRWHTATTSADDPGRYVSFTEDTTPGWVKVAVPSGSRTLMNTGFSIPTQKSYDTVVLTDAVSRSTEYLYLLTSSTTGSITSGVVSHWWHNTTTNSIQQIAEEVVTSAMSRPVNTTNLAWLAFTDEEKLSGGDLVVFDRGLWFLSPHLIVFGSAPDGRLFMARKPWGRIGYNSRETVGSSYRTQGSTAEDPRWTYYTGEGWSADPFLAGAVNDSTGTPITTEGPVSVATYRDRSWMATVASDGDNRHARIYTQRGQRPWKLEDTVFLGSVADGSYLGDNLRFQQQVSPSLSSDAMTTNTNDAAVVYVVSTRSTTTTEGENPVSSSSLLNTWGLWSVPRLNSRLSPLDSTALNAALTVTAEGLVETDTTTAGVGGS